MEYNLSEEWVKTVTLETRKQWLYKAGGHFRQAVLIGHCGDKIKSPSVFVCFIVVFFFIYQCICNLYIFMVV
jgi:hypothetical protein